MTEPKTELQRNYIAEQRRVELERIQRVRDMEWINNRTEDSRMARTLALIQQEAALEKDYQERTDHAAIVNAKAEKESKLAMEIAKVRNEEARKLLHKQALWREDQQLKLLVRKLKQGYVCRDIKQQIQQHEYRKIQDKNEELAIAAALRQSLYSDQEELAKAERDKFKRAQEYRSCLKWQLDLEEQKKREEEEQKKLDKKMIDEIMESIKNEDRRAKELKEASKKRLFQDMNDAYAASAAHKEHMRQLAEEQEKEVRRQAQLVADRTSGVIAERLRKIREREEINKKISDKTLADEAERQRRTDLIMLLQEQEHLEKNVQDEIAENNKSTNSKKDTRESLMSQMETRRKAAQEQMMRDAEYRRQTEARVAAENQKEWDKEMTKKQKNLKYRQELLNQIAANEKKRREDKEMEDRRNRSAFDYHKIRDAEAAEERKNILEEHGPYLLGSLQAGVLVKEDLPAIRKGANKDPKLAGLEIEKMAVRSRKPPAPKCNAQCMILREM